MFIEFLTSKFFFLVFPLVAFGYYVAYVRFHNWSIGLKWSERVWPIIEQDPRAVSDYFGRVRLGFCIIIGASIIAGAIS